MKTFKTFAEEMEYNLVQTIKKLLESDYKPLDRLRKNTIVHQITPKLSYHSGQARGQGTVGRKYPLSKDDVRVMTKSALDDPYEKARRERNRKHLFGEAEYSPYQKARLKADDASVDTREAHIEAAKLHTTAGQLAHDAGDYRNAQYHDNMATRHNGAAL